MNKETMKIFYPELRGYALPRCKCGHLKSMHREPDGYSRVCMFGRDCKCAEFKLDIYPQESYRGDDGVAGRFLSFSFVYPKAEDWFGNPLENNK